MSQTGILYVHIYDNTSALNKVTENLFQLKVNEALTIQHLGKAKYMLTILGISMREFSTFYADIMLQYFSRLQKKKRLHLKFTI